jgi:hypothetical protein
MIYFILFRNLEVWHVEWGVNPTSCIFESTSFMTVNEILLSTMTKLIFTGKFQDVQCILLSQVK